MCKWYVFHVIHCCPPALEVRLETKSRDPLGNVSQEWKYLHDVLAGDEPLRDPFRRDVECRCIGIVVFGEADAVHDLQDRRKKRAANDNSAEVPELAVKGATLTTGCGY